MFSSVIAQVTALSGRGSGRPAGPVGFGTTSLVAAPVAAPASAPIGVVVFSQPTAAPATLSPGHRPGRATHELTPAGPAVPRMFHSTPAAIQPRLRSASQVPRVAGYCTRAMAFVPPARHLLRAKDLADARYFEPLDVDDLARAAGLSRAHFSREFRRAFGESPHAYLLTRRLERAAALLRTTDRSVADICFSVGLQSVGSFTTSFTPHLRRVADRLPRGVPAGRRPRAGPGVRRARLRAPATPHVSRRQRRGAGLAWPATVPSTRGGPR